MSTEIEYEDAVCTIGTQIMGKPHLHTYHLLKQEEIINTHLDMIPSTLSTVLGWAGMFTRPKIYAFSEPNPWQDPVNPGAIPLDISNSEATNAKQEHHQDLWKF